MVSTGTNIASILRVVRDSIGFVVFFLFTTLLCFYLLEPTPIGEGEYATVLNTNETYQDLIEKKCANKELEQTVECLVGEVKKIYQYTITDDANPLTINELIENGGDCKDWADLYVEMGENLGVQAKLVSIKIIPGVMGHRFAVFSADGIYCTIDQRSYDCKFIQKYEDIFPEGNNTTNGTNK